MIINQDCDLLSLKLKGINLIEASAGTGKTYALVIIYLRVLLGLGEKNTFLEPLKIEEILVVTFMESSAKEIRNRIRKNINYLRTIFETGKINDSLFVKLFPYSLSKEQYRTFYYLLLFAENNIDKAAIYTIHGFCQQVINSNILESGVFFKKKLLEDEYFLYKKVSEDFWRKYCYSLPIEITSIIQDFWESPKDLLNELLPCLKGDFTIKKKLNCESILLHHKNIVKNINLIKSSWIRFEKKIKKNIENKENFKIYNKNKIFSWLKKIKIWAYQNTIDHNIPDELKYFKLSNLKKNKIINNFFDIFENIEIFYKNHVSLKEMIFNLALKKIRLLIKRQKDEKKEIGFEDLIDNLNNLLKKKTKKNIAKCIRMQYPIAMIDEFQDTNLKQFNIFKTIYYKKNNSCLLLIGDPKQAIYSFRGADIFSYISVRNKINIYNLNINWRSSPGMVNAINKLFQYSEKPFFFNKISFFPSFSAKKNDNFKFVIKDKVQSSLNIDLNLKSKMNLEEYKKYMAKKFAINIKNLLFFSKKGEAWLEGDKGKKYIESSDITILVRDYHEALLIDHELEKLSLSTIYLSNKKNVFHTEQAKEILWILQGILKPEEEEILNRALSTNIIGYSSKEIDILNNHSNKRTEKIHLFKKYYQQWKKYGVSFVFNKIIKDNFIVKKFLSFRNGKRKLIDFLHIIEILQENSIYIESELKLFRWLFNKITSSTEQTKKYQIRAESDRDLIKIITFHKSKGLEFPIVFLPFISGFRIQKNPIFHDRETNQLIWDINKKKNSLKLAEEERLAEDLRILYVAITRSIYYCNISIATIFLQKNKRNKNHDLHLSALGYLIQKGIQVDKKKLLNNIKELVKNANGDISFSKIFSKNCLYLKEKTKKNCILRARKCPNFKKNEWKTISYTSLRKENIFNPILTNENFKIREFLKIENHEFSEKKELNQHTFPRGKESGIFLHNLLKEINFSEIENIEWIRSKLIEENIDIIWLSTIKNWIKNIFYAQLNKKKLSLSKINKESKITELQFYLSINYKQSADVLDKLCKNYDGLSSKCSSLEFSKINGILKGSIDLIFYWKGLYYLLDYKSNWLGKDINYYTSSEIEKIMINHRYDLQYQIYTLALHKFLKYRLQDYNYEKQFGGIFYFFIRGAYQDKINNPVYYYKPNVNFINKLDNLFSNKIILSNKNEKIAF